MYPGFPNPAPGGTGGFSEVPNSNPSGTASGLDYQIMMTPNNNNTASSPRSLAGPSSPSFQPGLQQPFGAAPPGSGGYPTAPPMIGYPAPAMGTGMPMMMMMMPQGPPPQQQQQQQMLMMQQHQQQQMFAMMGMPPQMGMMPPGLMMPPLPDGPAKPGPWTVSLANGIGFIVATIIGFVIPAAGAVMLIVGLFPAGIFVLVFGAVVALITTMKPYRKVTVMCQQDGHLSISALSIGSFAIGYKSWVTAAQVDRVSFRLHTWIQTSRTKNGRIMTTVHAQTILDDQVIIQETDGNVESQKLAVMLNRAPQMGSGKWQGEGVCYCCSCTTCAQKRTQIKRKAPRYYVLKKKSSGTLVLPTLRRL